MLWRLRDHCLVDGVEDGQVLSLKHVHVSQLLEDIGHANVDKPVAQMRHEDEVCQNIEQI